MLPGNPCHDYLGYCDALGECQMIDMDGPFKTLLATFFSYEGIEMCHHFLCCFASLSCLIHFASIDIDRLPFDELLFIIDLCHSDKNCFTSLQDFL